MAETMRFTQRPPAGCRRSAYRPGSMFSYCLLLACGLLSAGACAADAGTSRVYVVSASTNQFGTSSRKHPPKINVLVGTKQDRVDITSDYVHGSGALLRLRSGRWPKAMLISLHTSDGTAYRMLDHFSVQTDRFKVNMQYGRKTQFPLLQKNRFNGQWSEVGVVNAVVRYTEQAMLIRIPPRLLRSNPKYLKLSWVYMFSIQ